MTYAGRNQRRFSLSGNLVGLLILCAGLSHFQGFALRGADEAKLYELEPYDEITLKEGQKVFKVLLLPINPREPVKEIDPQRKFEIRLCEHPERRYEVTGKDIETIRLYEELLLDQVKALIKDQQFDDAQLYLKTLEELSPQFPGVSAAVENAMFREAAFWHKQNESEHAWAILDELFQRNPNHERLEAAMLTVATPLVAPRLKNKDFAGASRFVESLSARFPTNETVSSWQQQITTFAEAALQSAQTHFASGDLREAHRAAVLARSVQPSLPGLEELHQRLEGQYPIAMVGVSDDSSSGISVIPSWQQRRLAGLTDHPAVELIALADGGFGYRSDWFDVQPAEDGLSATLAVHDALGLSGPQKLELASRIAGEISQGALARADGTLADAMHGLTLDTNGQIQIRWRVKSVEPLGILAGVLGQLDCQRDPQWSSYSHWSVAGASNGETAFRHDEGSESAEKPYFAEVVERHYADISLAYTALRQGAIMSIDRVPPWDVARLTSREELLVTAYLSPTCHFLLVNGRRGWLSHRGARIALSRAIDRESILNDTILGGRTDGGRLLGGPFPILSAADATLRPPVYRPQVAVSLVEALDREQAGNAPREIQLELAHPACAPCRVGASAVAGQLRLLPGVNVNLTQVDGHDPASEHSTDLMYVEWPALDAVMDYRRLLALPMLSGINDRLVRQLCQNAHRAKDPQSARRALQELQRYLVDEGYVIPLWQFTEYCAVNKRLSGLGAPVTSLYDHLPQWRLTP